MRLDKERRAAVLDESLIKRLLAVARDSKHALRNEVMIHLSFGLGLRAKEMAALKVNNGDALVDDANKQLQRIEYLSTRQAVKRLN